MPLRQALARLIVLSVLVSASFLSVGVAHADDGSPRTNSDSESETWANYDIPVGSVVSARTRLGSVAGQVGAQLLPSDCIGTGSTYKTSTSGGRANGRAVTNCQAYYAELHNYSDLRRDRGVYIEFLDDDVSSTYGSRSVTSISIWGCAGAGLYTYFSHGDYTAIAVGGTAYYGVTDTSKRFTC